MNLADELIELQTRIAFQEDTINQLNQVITKQGADILQLKHQMRLLAKRLDDVALGQVGEGDEIANERPPHY